MTRTLDRSRRTEQEVNNQRFYKEIRQREAPVGFSIQGVTVTAPPPPQTVLERLRGISPEEPKIILRDVSLEIPAGETTVVVGPSGSGKSTVLRLLSEQNQPNDLIIKKGNVLANGIDVSHADPVTFHEVVMKLSQHQQPAHTTIRNNIRRLLKVHGATGEDEILVRTEEILKQVNLWLDLQNRLNDDAYNLSGGQRQRLVLAGIVGLNPRVILLDEPTAALDPMNAMVFAELIRSIVKQRNMTAVVVTHDFAVAKHIADTVAVVDEGEIVERAPVDEVFNSPKHPKTQELLAMHGLLQLQRTPANTERRPSLLQQNCEDSDIAREITDIADIIRSSIAELDLGELTKARAEHDLDSLHGHITKQQWFQAACVLKTLADKFAPEQETHVHPSEKDREVREDTVLSVEKLRATVQAEGKVLLDGIDIDGRQGEILGVIGESGGGKSTLLRAITKLSTPGVAFTTYALKVLGKNFTNASTEDFLGTYIAFVLQNQTFPESSVYDAVAMGPRTILGSGDPQKIYDLVMESLQNNGAGLMSEIDGDVSRMLASLSGGQRQRVAIAAALAMKAPVVVLDEPTADLDPESTRRIEAKITALRNQGKFVILVSHNLDLIDRVADRVLLVKGKAVEIGNTEEVLLHSHALTTKMMLLFARIFHRFKIQAVCREEEEGAAA